MEVLSSLEFGNKEGYARMCTNDVQYGNIKTQDAQTE